MVNEKKYRVKQFCTIAKSIYKYNQSYYAFIKFLYIGDIRWDKVRVKEAKRKQCNYG